MNFSILRKFGGGLKAQAGKILLLKSILLVVLIEFS